MATYSELLSSDEWKNKRREILENNLSCYKCKNIDLLSPLSIGYITKTDYNINSVSGMGASVEGLDYDKRVMFKNCGTILLNVYDEPNNPLKTNKCYIVYFDTGNLDSRSRYSPIALAEVDSVTKSTVKMCRMHENPYRKKDFIQSANFFWVKGLHIHHTYYQDGKLPWEYPADSLMVLCWKCHENLHNNCKIPWRNHNGDVVSELTPCKKCKGIGYFPEFVHVENGICFKCWGARYYEFM